MFLKHSSGLFHEAAYNGVQCWHQSVNAIVNHLKSAQEDKVQSKQLHDPLLGCKPPLEKLLPQSMFVTHQLQNFTDPPDRKNSRLPKTIRGSSLMFSASTRSGGRGWFRWRFRQLYDGGGTSCPASSEIGPTGCQRGGQWPRQRPRLCVSHGRGEMCRAADGRHHGQPAWSLQVGGNYGAWLWASSKHTQHLRSITVINSHYVTPLF